MSVWLRSLRTTVPLGVVLSLGLSLGCVVRLNDPYKNYSADGDVSGDPATCDAPPAEGNAVQNGPKAARIIGRVSTAPGDPMGTTRLVWSGTTVSARFSGATEVYAKLTVTNVSTADNNDPITNPAQSFYTSSVDGTPTLVTVDGTVATSQIVQIASGLDSGPHEISFSRESDSGAGTHLFYGLFSDAAATKPLSYLPATVRPRRIQVIGDSVACGAGVLGANAACVFGYDTERSSSSFGALAAAKLDAELTNVSIRTVGVLINADGSSENTISTLYGCADPSVAPCVSAGDLTKDPAPPQVIVLELGTSDIVRANPPAAIGDFQVAYESFVKSVRQSYPKAHVFCTLSPLFTDLNTKSQRTDAKNAIHAVVTDLNDPKIYALDFPDQGSENGLGCEENPSPKVQQIMGDILATAIHEKTCW